MTDTNYTFDAATSEAIRAKMAEAEAALDEAARWVARIPTADTLTDVTEALMNSNKARDRNAAILAEIAALAAK